MRGMEEKLFKKTFIVEKKLDWQLLGEEMSSFYNKPMYSIINKFKKTKGLTFVSEKFIIQEKKKDRSLTNLMQLLNNSL